MALLREKILQESEKIKDLMKPAFFVRETIRKAHEQILPEVTPDLIKMFPDPDFGNDIFSASLPGKMQKKLSEMGMEPLFITVTSPWFRKVHFWFARQLHQQCSEPENLAAAMAYKLITVTSGLYEQCFRNQKPMVSLRATHRKLFDFGFISGQNLEFKYLNRFCEFTMSHDTVKEQFTDYFGRQAIFYYPYTCISHGNLHGSYLAGFLQSSLHPAAILKGALNKADSRIKAGIFILKEPKSGFFENDYRLEYYARPPTEFWNHNDFYRRFHHRKESQDTGKYFLRLSADAPGEVVQMRNSLRFFKFAAGMLLLVYLMIASHYWLFGMKIRIGIRRKLILLLTVIIMIPVIGIGMLTAIDLKGADRILENHVLKKTQELIKEFMEYDNENDFRFQLVMLEMKRRMEEYRGIGLNPRQVFVRPGEKLFWLNSRVANNSWLDENGNIAHFTSTLEPVDEGSKMIFNAILPKYLDNLGLLKRQGNNLSSTLTLGIFEDYITPAREETVLPHETTMHRNISHTLDTSRAATILTRTPGCGYVFAYPRVCDGDRITHAYLGEFSRDSLKWFRRFDDYCDIDLSAKLRRFNETSTYGWPLESRPDEEKLKIFANAIVIKDTGNLIFNTENGAKTWAWSYRPGRSCLFAATGRSREGGFGRLTFGMLFPMLAGYGILLIMVLSMLFAEFIVKPVGIFSDAVHKLDREEYGIQVKKFSGDEFSLITSAFNKMSAALKQREMIKRLVSAKLIEKIENSSENLVARTEMQCVSVVASDIRGFTSISEKFTPSEVVELLNTYFTAMEEVITPNNGIIDKYIGDAIQVVFFEKAGIAAPAVRACRTALAMRKKLFELNRQRAEKQLFALENGIGIASGMAVSGSIGSKIGRKDFTIVGRVTEQAASLEARTVKTASRILICKNTQAASGNDFMMVQHDEESWELTDAR